MATVTQLWANCCHSHLLTLEYRLIITLRSCARLARVKGSAAPSPPKTLREALPGRTILDSCQCIHQPHLVNGTARHIEQSGACKHHGQCLRARNRHVQPVDAE